MPLGLRLVQSQKPYLSEITTLTYNASGCGNGGFEDRNFRKEVSNHINGMESKNHHKPHFSIYTIRFLTGLFSLPSVRDLVNNQVKFASLCF